MNTEPTTALRVIESGPFKGRVYEIRPDGSTGRRRAELERKPSQLLERMVREIPNQAALDAILAREPNAMTRATMLDQWRPWLSFMPE